MSSDSTSVPLSVSGVPHQAEDLRRADFLRAMDASDETFYQFEVEFIASFMRDRAGKPEGTDYLWFTDRRRWVVDQMISRYGFRSTRPVPRVRSIPEAEPGKCGYLVRDPERGGNQRCGQPATCKIGELELCEGCRNTREEGFARLKKTLRP